MLIRVAAASALALMASSASAWSLLNLGNTWGEPNFFISGTGASAVRGNTFLQADAAMGSLPLNFKYYSWSATEPGMILVPGDPSDPLVPWMMGTPNPLPFATIERSSMAPGGALVIADGYDNISELPGGTLVSGADLQARLNGTVALGASAQSAWGRQFELTLSPGASATFTFSAQASIQMAPTDTGTGIVTTKLLTYDTINSQWNFNSPLDQESFFVSAPGTGTSGFHTVSYTFENSSASTIVERVWLEGNVAVFSAPIPEPGTWALMLGSLGIIGAAVRRRRVN